MYIILGLLSAIFASSVAVLGKLGLKGIDSTLATTIRSIIMAAFLIVVSLLAGKWQSLNWQQLSQKDWWLIIGSGIFGALSWLAYFAALKSGPALSVAALDRLSLVFVAILSVLILGDSLSWLKGLGLVLILSGVMLVTYK